MDLRQQYEDETGESCLNGYDAFSDGYVEWLLDKLKDHTNYQKFIKTHVYDEDLETYVPNHYVPHMSGSVPRDVPEGEDIKWMCGDCGSTDWTPNFKRCQSCIEVE